MRKFFESFLRLLLVAFLFTEGGCTDKKPKPVSEDSTSTMTMAPDTTEEDSTEQLIASTPMPKAADELFDDFIFNYAANKRLQMKRTIFPLPVYKNGKLAGKLPKSSWKMEHFFMRQDFYTLIFDNMKQMKLAKDTTIDHVVIEKIYFNKKTVKQYLFNRINGKWNLTSLNVKPMYQNMNASFLKFYQRFATDTAFQMRHINNPVKFTGPNPDDDFSTLTGDLLPQQWPMFAPKLPTGMIYNIIYGQKYTESTQKIFVIRGIANGLEQEFTFRLRHGRWLLMAMSV